MNEILIHLSQFGMAGLIGAMWMLERRAAAQRNRQLEEAHERLITARCGNDVLLAVVKENTRAVASLEASQRELIGLLRMMSMTAPRLTAPAASGPPSQSRSTSRPVEGYAS